ncbi:MAG: cofactor-independent phosphoglycerate mutase [Clostridia bacterium]|nr:cofactor-independent phosphoglycerate mutase [Clostridia bacterium]
MKYIVVLADGMADYPLAELGNKTPLQAAQTPSLNYLAQYGQVGMVKTIPDGMPPGSDTANLSVMGYDPAVYYFGRSPFEAVSMGLELAPTDVVFRTNVVTLSEEEPYAEKIILDHSADEISSAEARELIEAVQQKLGTEKMQFFPGVSYRHILVWQEAPFDFQFTPPHDILGQKIANFLPRGPYGHIFLEMMQQSSLILSEHPVNLQRRQRGLKPANSIWIWGEGKKPALPGFYEKYGLKGSVISAVDLIKGIGLCAGLDALEVAGATGNYNTNYEGKARAALDALESGQDFVYIHLEGPDECGHRREIENKVKAIESIDARIVRPIMEEMSARGEEYSLMVLPDHPTPLCLRTHTSEPVPFLLYRSAAGEYDPARIYDEDGAKKTGLFIEQGHSLMDYFIKESL